MARAFKEHPLYPEWRKKLDDVVVAQARADNAISEDEKIATAKALRRAQMRFSAIADDLIWVPYLESLTRSE